MKIIYAVPEGSDLGGIITSSENLIAALRELGHTVEFALLRPMKSSHIVSEPPETGYTIGEGTRRWMNPIYGWKGGMAYGINRQGFYAFLHAISGADLLIWGSLYGLKTKETETDKLWLSFFDLIHVPMLAFVRDDHIPGRAAWIGELDQYVDGWLCVQPCSMKSVEHLSKPKYLVYSGHNTSVRTGGKYDTRSNLVSVIQSFKSWKNGDKVVAAVPEIRAKVVLAGDGIVRRYMTSPDKNKYFNSEGKAIWPVALEHGMEYRKVISEIERTLLLNRSKFLIDLSRRGTEGQINRIVVEAMLAGCIPICVSEFIEKAGFKPGVNFLPTTPETVAQDVNFYLDNINEETYNKIQAINYDFVNQFSRKVSAERIVEAYESSQR
jgi:hypothetical protein